VSERLELADESPGRPVGVLLDEVVAAEVVVDLTGGEHVPDGGEDRVADGRDGFVVAAAAVEAPVLGGEVGVFGLRRGERGLGQCRA
jgi:hypothetical protein